MSLYTLPFLYLNLGGEMVYILQQRLKAQKINEQKQKKVMQDIVRHMLSDSVLSTLFTAQPITTTKRLRTNFTKLANTSIINLNENSMDKLYDLMLMTFKYQLLLCKSGHELILLTLNHLDGLREIIEDEGDCVKMVNKTSTRLTEAFHNFSEGQLSIIRHTLLSFLQECNRKVSLFLAKKLQLPNSEFVLPHGGRVPYGAQPPGMVRYLYGDHKVEMVTLWCHYDGMERKGCLDVTGDRVVTIGENLYCSESSSESLSKKTRKARSSKHSEKRTQEATADHSVKAELDFLHHLLIGFQQPPLLEPDFRLQLFDSPAISAPNSDRKPINLAGAIQIPKMDSKGHITDVLKDFDSITESGNTSQQTADGNEGAEGLLDLMDAL